AGHATAPSADHVDTKTAIANRAHLHRRRQRAVVEPLGILVPRQRELWLERDRALTDTHGEEPCRRGVLDIAVKVIREAERGADFDDRKILRGRENGRSEYQGEQENDSGHSSKGVTIAPSSSGLEARSTSHPAPSTQHSAPSTQHPAPSTQHPTLQCRRIRLRPAPRSCR